MWVRRRLSVLCALSTARLNSATQLFCTTKCVTTTPELTQTFSSLLDSSREQLRMHRDDAHYSDIRRITMIVTAQMGGSRSETPSNRSPGELRRRRWADARKKGRELQARLAAAVGPTEVECVDCARDSAETLAAAVRRADCVWVSGGNTFFLWHHMQQSGMDEMVKAHVRKGALYVGCSAGAIVAGQSIETAFWKGWDDPNVVNADWGDERRIRAMGLAPCCFFPHYEPEWKELVERRRKSLSAAAGSEPRELVCLEDTTAYVMGALGKRVLGTRAAEAQQQPEEEAVPTGAGPEV